MCPEPVADCTVAAMVDAVAAVTSDRVTLIRTLSFAKLWSKFVPVTVTAVPAVPIVGVKLVIVGAPESVATVKLLALVAEPAGAVTVIGPVVAPAGTDVTICEAVAEATVALVPWKLTES